MTRPNPEQQFIIESPLSVSIDAGAGTGKTFVLTRRILNLLRSGLKAEELVAVTFTEAAAAELRSRLQTLLDEEAQRLHDPQLLEAARALPLAQISTIHALCARILRDHPVESGAGMRFTVLDEAQTSVWMEQNLPEVLGELSAADFGEIPAQHALDAVSLMLRDPYRAEQALQVSMRTQAGEEAELKARLVEERAALADRWEKSLLTLQSYAATSPTDPLEVGRQAVLHAAQADGSWDVRCATMRSVLSGIRRSAGTAKVWQGHKDEIHHALNELRAITQPLPLEQQLWQCQALPVLEKLYYQAQEKLDERKRQQEILTFADLERLAAQALAEPQVRQYYARRWKALLVDEFQDTSPLQWEIISALSEHGLNFTVVGDEKQSIYAFRGADVTLFRKARQSVAVQGGESRALTTSFRTHHALVEVVNTFFANYMPGPVSPESTAATFSPLKASRQTPPFPSDTCEFHVVTGAGLKDPMRQAEARLIAHRIQSLLSEGRAVDGRGSSRPLAYRDIAILLRTRTHLAQYEAALFTAGIPYVVQGGTGLLWRPEVRDLRSLLQFLANPADDLALAATLRSPLVGWTDEQLLNAARTRSTEESLWSSLDAPPELLSRLLDARASRSASALITLALEHSDFGPVMATMPDGQRRLANIDAFLGLLHRYATEGRGGVQQVSRALQESVRLELPVPEATLGSDDAVQIMTIHGSKGLEYPVIIIPDLLAEGRSDSAPVLIHEEHGLSLRIPGVKPDDHPERHRFLLDLAAERRFSEDERIKYVALTRAADTLILTLTAKTSELPTAQQLSRFLPLENVARFSYQPEQIPPVPRRLLSRQGEVYFSRDERGVALPDHLPVTSIGVYLRCPREFEYRYVTGRPPFTALWEADTRQREGGASGAMIGSAVHQAIELGLSEALIQGRFPHLSEAERQEVGQLVARLQGTPFAALLLQTPQRELQVTAGVKGLTFEGVIDALYEGWVVDYKTDRRMEPEDHLPQLALYCAATGAPRASLAYLRHGQLYDYSAADLERGLGLVDCMVEGVQALNFAPAPSVARCTFCAYRQVCDAALVED